MKIFKSVFIFLLIVVVFLTFLEVIPTAPRYSGANPWIIDEGERPLIIPHGGAKELYPENTVYAFEKIDEAGYDVFEIDLTLTRDDILTSHHDVSLKDTAGQDVLVRDLEYDAIKNIFLASEFALNYRDFDGQPVPNLESVKDKMIPAKLEDLFTSYPDKMYILELKDTIENSGSETFEIAVNELLDLIVNKKMQEKVIVSSFDDTITTLIREKSNNTIMTSTATNETLKFVLFSTLRADFFYRPVDGALLIPFKDDLSASQVKLADKVPALLRDLIITTENGVYYTNFVKKNIVTDAHRHNMAIHYWTVNDENEMRKLVEFGVDGIITDRPDLLKTVLDEMYRE
jgi:glycerophosphoryl diester phosphodiesterase